MWFLTPSGDNFTPKIYSGQVAPKITIVWFVFFVLDQTIETCFCITSGFYRIARFTGLPDSYSFHIFGSNWHRNFVFASLPLILGQGIWISPLQIWQTIRVARFMFLEILRKARIWQQCWCYPATLMVGHICKDDI